MKRFILLLTGVFALTLVTSSAQAASSGCYSWHSCPSTTGSYVCGDTGHCSQCPDNQYCSSGSPRLSAQPTPAASSTPPQVAPTSPTTQNTAQYAPSARTKITDCVVNGASQDMTCTPGAILNVTAKTVCRRGYSKSVRNVSTKTKNQVFKEYGIEAHSGSTYEVDHLISLELGGSNDIANLWPKPQTHALDSTRRTKLRTIFMRRSARARSV